MTGSKCSQKGTALPISLHAALVPSMLQIIGSVDKLLDTAESWCDENGHSHDEVIGARLIDDMLPFAYQVKSCWSHSALAIDGVRAGLFSPDMNPPPDSFAGLHQKLHDATKTLGGVSEEELEELAGKDMRFQLGKKFRMDFNGQDFLLSFSQPNFYFHAATAYDILRTKGIGLGKRDYLGSLRIKT